MLKEQEQQEREEENNTNIATTAQATVAHEKNWGSIFGKKGLITGGLMLLSPLLLKLLKWLISGPGKELGNLLLNGLKGLVGFLDLVLEQSLILLKIGLVVLIKPMKINQEPMENPWEKLLLENLKMQKTLLKNFPKEIFLVLGTPL